MKRMLVGGAVALAAGAATVAFAAPAQARPPGDPWDTYSSRAACVAAGDDGLQNGYFQDYTCLSGPPTVWTLYAVLS